jgi:hypothetical protein
MGQFLDTLPQDVVHVTFGHADPLTRLVASWCCKRLAAAYKLRVEKLVPLEHAMLAIARGGSVAQYEWARRRQWECICEPEQVYNRGRQACTYQYLHQRGCNRRITMRLLGERPDWRAFSSLAGVEGGWDVYQDRPEAIDYTEALLRQLASLGDLEQLKEVWGAYRVATINSGGGRELPARRMYEECWRASIDAGRDILLELLGIFGVELGFHRWSLLDDTRNPLRWLSDARLAQFVENSPTRTILLLDAICDRGSLPLLQSFVEKHPFSIPPNYTSLQIARYGTTEMLQYVLHRYRHIRGIDTIMPELLLEAIHTSNLPVIQYLLDQGVDVQALDVPDVQVTWKHIFQRSQLATIQWAFHTLACPLPAVLLRWALQCPEISTDVLAFLISHIPDTSPLWLHHTNTRITFRVLRWFRSTYGDRVLWGCIPIPGELDSLEEVQWWYSLRSAPAERLCVLRAVVYADALLCFRWFQPTDPALVAAFNWGSTRRQDSIRILRYALTADDATFRAVPNKNKRLREESSAREE